jgi:hypothetical protein
LPPKRLALATNSRFLTANNRTTKMPKMNKPGKPMQLIKCGKEISIDPSRALMHHLTAESQRRNVPIERVLENLAHEAADSELAKAQAECDRRGISLDELVKEKGQEALIKKVPKAPPLKLVKK